MNIKIDTKSKFYMNEFEIDNKNNYKSKVIYNKLLLPNFCLAKHNVLVLLRFRPIKPYVLENIASIIKFYIIYSSLSTYFIFIIIDKVYKKCKSI